MGRAQKHPAHTDAQSEGSYHRPQDVSQEVARPRVRAGHDACREHCKANERERRDDARRPDVGADRLADRTGDLRDPLQHAFSLGVREPAHIPAQHGVVSNHVRCAAACTALMLTASNRVLTYVTGTGTGIGHNRPRTYAARGRRWSRRDVTGPARERALNPAK